ncbi:MAG: hypothetical protein RL329_1197 [Bacteroidota bacterium]|jgi:hypothetical protein
METFLIKLEEIVDRKFKVDSRGGAYRLEEPKVLDYPQTMLKKTEGNMLVYNFDVLDSNQSVFPIFNASAASVTAICDYIVFYPKNGKLFVFLCNLKSKQTSAKSQAEAGWLFTDYMLQTVRRLLNFMPISVEYRSLVFSSDAKVPKLMSNARKEKKYIVLGNSNLLNKLLKAGSDCYLDQLCF